MSDAVQHPVVLVTRPCPHRRQEDLDAIARVHRIIVEELTPAAQRLGRNALMEQAVANYLARMRASMAEVP